MANRHILHISKLKAFEEWLDFNGWDIQDTEADSCEVLRAKKTGRKYPLIVYKKDRVKEHLSVADRDERVVKAFLKKY